MRCAGGIVSLYLVHQGRRRAGVGLPLWRGVGGILLCRGLVRLQQIAMPYSAGGVSRRRGRRRRQRAKERFGYYRYRRHCRRPNLSGEVVLHRKCVHGTPHTTAQSVHVYPWYEYGAWASRNQTDPASPTEAASASDDRPLRSTTVLASDSASACPSLCRDLREIDGRCSRIHKDPTGYCVRLKLSKSTHSNSSVLHLSKCSIVKYTSLK